jgi:DNA repair protein RadC
MTEKKKLFSLIPQVEVSMVREIKAASKSYRSSEEVAGSEFAASLLKSDREKFLCLHLNVKNQIISFEVVSTGSLTSSIVHPREVYKGAILANAASVIFMHNHPSGDPEPSTDDMEITKRLEKAGNILGIDVLDHIIVASSGFYSFRQHNLLNGKE